MTDTWTTLPFSDRSWRSLFWPKNKSKNKTLCGGGKILQGHLPAHSDFSANRSPPTPSTTYFTVSQNVCYSFYLKFLHLSARSFLSLHTQGSHGRIFILYVYVFRSCLSVNGRSTIKACQVSLPVTPRYQVKWDCWRVTYKILIWSLTRTPCVALGKSQHLSAATFPWLKCLFVC